MYPAGLFGLDWLRVLITPIGIFGITFFVLYVRHDGARAGRVIMLMLMIAIVGLLGAKVFSLWTRGWEWRSLSAELSGGLRYPGAMIAIVLLSPLLKRLIVPELKVTRFLDVLAITVCFSFALIRVSCFLNGCCTGMQCDEGYCLSYPVGTQPWYYQLQAGLLPHADHPSHPVLPLHLLFMGASFAVGIFLLWFDGRRSFDGQVALLYLVLHDGAKGLLESLRDPYVAQLQITSLTTSLIALIVLLFILYRRRTATATA